MLRRSVEPATRCGRLSPSVIDWENGRCEKRSAIIRIWCLFLGFAQFYIGAAGSFLTVPRASFGLFMFHVFLPMASGITLVAGAVFASRRQPSKVAR